MQGDINYTSGAENSIFTENKVINITTDGPVTKGARY